MVPYLISYLVSGLIFAVSMLLNGQLARGYRLRRCLFLIVGWPLIVLVAPEGFLGPPAKQEEKPDPLEQRLNAALGEAASLLSEEFNASLVRAASKGTKSVAYFSDKAEFAQILGEYWHANIPPAVHNEVRWARQALVERKDAPLGALGMQSRREPDWLVGFSTEFIKSITHTEAKLRGRILDAVGKISVAPIDPVGDTIKPLSGTAGGLWRYRIGDHRLVYLPDAQSKKITLLFFGSRGDVYSNL